MAATLSGASVAQENRNESDIRYDMLGKNSEVFNVGDLVTVASGVLLVGTSPCVGVAVKKQTMGPTNQTSGVLTQVYPGYIPVDNNTIFLMNTNSDLTGNATNGGTYYSVTGTTGAQKVDVTRGVVTGAARCVEIVKVDPYGYGGTGAGSGLRYVLVRIVNTPYTNVNITA